MFSWIIIGTLAVFISAFIIIKLSINAKENPDSKLGILEHPSTYKKPDVEMVDSSSEANKKS